MPQKIISDIAGYLQTCGVRSWSEVYVGISADACDRLFNGHGVRQDFDPWIYRDAGSAELARAIEAHLLGQGAVGGPGGGDGTARYVYAFRIGSHTRE